MNDLENNQNANAFFENVAQIIEKARRFVGRTADVTMCVTYFEIGYMIVEEEQCGKARAEYGKNMLSELSAYLSKRIGKGFSVSTLTNARKFYMVYSPTISQSIITKSEEDEASQKSQTLFTKLESSIIRKKSQTLFTKSIDDIPFTLS